MISGSELDQALTSLDGLALLDQDRGNRASCGSSDLGLHLHGLQNQENLAGLHLVALRHEDAGH